MTDTPTSFAEHSEDPEVLDRLIIRFAGDSGDGMQLAGNRFTDASALFGNDLATFPSFPAEIRAPAGTIAGVSSFQVQIADFDIHTAGDDPDVLIAMNPAAMMAHLKDLRPAGTIIVNTDAFDERNLKKAGYDAVRFEFRILGKASRDGERWIVAARDPAQSFVLTVAPEDGESLVAGAPFVAQVHLLAETARSASPQEPVPVIVDARF